MYLRTYLCIYVNMYILLHYHKMEVSSTRMYYKNKYTMGNKNEANVNLSLGHLLIILKYIANKNTYKKKLYIYMYVNYKNFFHSLSLD